jgi:hypothetical protein
MEPTTRSRQCKPRDGDVTKGVRTLAHLGSASGSLLRWPWGFAGHRVLRTRMRSRASYGLEFRDSTAASLPSAAGSSASEASGNSRGHRTSHAQFRLLAPAPSVALQAGRPGAAVPRWQSRAESAPARRLLRRPSAWPGAGGRWQCWPGDMRRARMPSCRGCRVRLPRLSPTAARAHTRAHAGQYGARVRVQSASLLAQARLL